MIEVTYGFVKPDGYGKRDEIKRMIQKSGLDIVAEKDPYLFSRELAERHYKSKEGEYFYNILIDYVISGPTSQLVMLGEGAVKNLSDLIGHMDPRKALPNTIRSMYGTKLPYNAFHRADSKFDICREIGLHFRSRELPADVICMLERYKMEISQGLL